MKFFRCYILLLLSLNLTFSDADAAQISIVQDTFGNTIVAVEGVIERGDLQTIQAKAAEAIHSADGMQSNTLQIHLNTPGGDVMEAIKIGRFLREILAEVNSYGNTLISKDHPASARFSDLAEPNERYGYVLLEREEEVGSGDIVQNLSAGVLIFYGGVRRAHRDNSDERAGWPGNVIPVFGIHRPYFDRESFASLEPNEASDAYATLIEEVESYLDEMGAPSSLLDVMLNVPSDDIRYYGDKDFRQFYRAEAPFLNEWLTSKCGSTNADGGLEGVELSDFKEMQEWQSRHRAADKSPTKYDTDLYPNPNFDENYLRSIWSKARSHNIEVGRCRKTAVVDHQSRWAKSFNEQAVSIGGK